jgi:hypothetical protein
MVCRCGFFRGNTGLNGAGRNGNSDGLMEEWITNMENV